MKEAARMSPRSPEKRGLTFSIEGMDCPSCAGTIRSALENVPGVARPEVSLARAQVALDLDTRVTAVEDIQKIIRKLGFVPGPVAEDGAADIVVAPDEPDGKKAWWQAAKVQYLLLSLVLVALAYLTKIVFPKLDEAAFTAATVIAVYPVARRAVAAARLGAVFTIQMLMTTAAAGAIVIGEQEEAAIVVLLFMIGEFLEGLAAERARSGIRPWALCCRNRRFLTTTARCGRFRLIRSGSGRPS